MTCVMPYFVYQIDRNGEIPVLTHLETFDAFRDAKADARRRRAEMTDTTKKQIKIVFADNTDTAVAHLLERREAPILKEWEK